jgi:RES domain-containing protein
VDRNLANAVAGTRLATIDGVFERHAALGVPTLRGSNAGGRWGPPGAYPVLYLGRPRDSLVVEAYRHLVDDIEGMTGDLVAPRRVFICRVHMSQLLDLRDRENLLGVGLTLAALTGPHEPCQEVGQAAHQLGLHGVISPAATRLGETLALFEQHLTPTEMPVVIEEQFWPHLPADPRILRIVEVEEGGP